MEVFFEPCAVTNLEERAQQTLQGGQSEEKSKYGISVQMEWMPPCHGGDRGFESRISRLFIPP